MKTTIRIALLSLAVIAALAATIWLRKSHSSSNPMIHVSDHSIIRIQDLTQLTVTEFHTEQPVLDSIGSRHIFARQILRGTISYNLDSITTTHRNDTLIVTLPQPTITILESTEPHAWEILKRWNTRLLSSSNFTNAEINTIKHRARQKAIRALLTDSLLHHSRTQALTTLRPLLPSTLILQ